MKLLFIALFLLCVSATAQSVDVNGAGQALTSKTYSAYEVDSPQLINNNNFKGGHFIFTTTTYTSGTYTPHIQGMDSVTGNWYDILVGTGTNVINSTGTIVLKVYPGIGSIPGGAANDILPLNWRVQLIGASTPNMVLSVEYNLDY